MVEALDSIAYALQHMQKAMRSMTMQMEKTDGVVRDVAHGLSRQKHLIQKIDKRMDDFERTRLDPPGNAMNYPGPIPKMDSDPSIFIDKTASHYPHEKLHSLSSQRFPSVDYVASNHKVASNGSFSWQNKLPNRLPSLRETNYGSATAGASPSRRRGLTPDRVLHSKIGPPDQLSTNKSGTPSSRNCASRSNYQSSIPLEVRHSGLKTDNSHAGAAHFTPNHSSTAIKNGVYGRCSEIFRNASDSKCNRELLAQYGGCTHRSRPESRGSFPEWHSKYAPIGMQPSPTVSATKNLGVQPRTVSNPQTPSPTRPQASEEGQAGAMEKNLSSAERMSIMGRRLLKAAHFGKIKLVRKLLECGADPNYSTAGKWTPLLRAAARAHTNVVSMLVSRGAEVNATNCYGFSALHISAYDDYTGRCVSILIDSGAEIDCKNKFGRTPLHYAAESGNLAAVLELLAAGAKRSIEDDAGKTPFDVAHTSCFRRILHPSTRVNNIFPFVERVGGFKINKTKSSPETGSQTFFNNVSTKRAIKDRSRNPYRNVLGKSRSNSVQSICKTMLQK